MPTLYQNIRNDLKTGDLVLFAGRGLVSATIKYSTFSKWSHVGMIINMPEYDFVTVWESTTLSKAMDLETHAPRSGVQLVPLSARVRTYNGEIAVRQLEGLEPNHIDVNGLMELRKEVSRRPYEQSKLELIKSAYDGPFGHNEEDLSSLFCSELVAEAYQRMGLLSEQKPSNEYTPADFSQEKDLTLTQGSLGEEVLIKDD